MTGPIVFCALLLFTASASGHRTSSVRRLRFAEDGRDEHAVDAALRGLRTALLSGDGPAVLKITAELRRPFEATILANTTAAVDATVSQRDASNCLFDDRLFSLTPEAKSELAAELDKKDVQEQLEFVRKAGWWSCASEGNACTCMGEVRFVDMARQPLGKLVNGADHEGEVSCLGEVFGLEREAPKPGAAVSAACECYGKGGSRGPIAQKGEHYAEFHLQRRLTSKSYLQESWIFLLRFLGRMALLPLGTGDRTYHGMQNWAARTGDGNYEKYPVVVLERFWINRYMIDFVKPYVPANSSCLEWGDPKTPGKGFTYANDLPQCSSKYDIQFDYTYWRKTPMQVWGNVVYSDIISLPTVLGTLKMDVIFATQVFEHLADPLAAARSLYQATSPGGMVVFTAPQQAQFHKVPHDYIRYTKEGVKYTLVQAGFCVPNWGFAGGGDFVMDIARNAGLQVQDFSLDEMEASFQHGYDQVSDGAIAIHALAFKEPHGQCNDPTAGWAELSRQGIHA
eukprot:gnl/TRDRNA2_/TRDRNA2_166997_c0_seq5.p1 gnl/TRDRNA2_/TRDRNA2_166997_c0~~gnl/TRDRNA2_/TRDRNA2_166997_c0_seq5.p1  ORF type:complete len:511 (-),score=91.03 gnl/TRDRNA2_/TRDRNA2_166997_c0_seq5:41-1573(-)